MRGLLVAGLLLSGMAFPSAVAGACDPNAQSQAGNWHAVAFNNEYPTINGVTAYVRQYRGHVENWGEPGSLGWVMLNDGVVRWAQVGYWQTGGLFDTSHVFIQYTPVHRDNGWDTFWYPPENNDAFIQQTVLYESIGGQMQWRFFSDNVNLRNMPAWWDPQMGQIGSEIQNLANQMPGNFGDLHWAAYNQMQKRTNQWFAFAPTDVTTSNDNLWYASNTRGGMDPLRELVTADKRGDCS
jgi:hypothetical protein